MADRPSAAAERRHQGSGLARCPDPFWGFSDHFADLGARLWRPRGGESVPALATALVMPPAPPRSRSGTLVRPTRAPRWALIARRCVALSSTAELCLFSHVLQHHTKCLVDGFVPLTQEAFQRDEPFFEDLAHVAEGARDPCVEHKYREVPRIADVFERFRRRDPVGVG